MGSADGGTPAGSAGSGDPAQSAAQRRRRLAEVFGDALPEQTSDDRDADGEPGSEAAGDAWLRAQVPPHHGG